MRLTNPTGSDLRASLKGVAPGSATQTRQKAPFRLQRSVDQRYPAPCG